MWGGQGIRAFTDLGCGAGGIRRKKTKLRDRGEKPSRGKQRDRVKMGLPRFSCPEALAVIWPPLQIGAAKPMSLERRRNNLPCVFLLLC